MRILTAVCLMAAVCGLLVAGCAPLPPRVPPPPALPRAALQRLDPEQYPLFSDCGAYGPLLRSIDLSVAYLRRLPPERRILFGDDPYTASHLIRSLQAFAAIVMTKPSEERLNQAIEKRFHVYRSIGRTGRNDVLFTGYYEPLLDARLSPTPDFSTPVHSKPQDLLEIDLSAFAPDLKGRTIVGRYTGRTVVPYPSRGEIRQTADFNAKAPPVVWLRDEIDLFILQIQGSGRVRLEDGTRRHILYDGSNGRPYQSVGRLLIDEGRIAPERMSMQAIRTYLRQHPDARERILDHNPRYIFFKTAEQGPLGSLGQPLTPMRSLAVDRSVMPSAALAYISVPLPDVSPDGELGQWRPYTGFALAQDAGSAIKGPGRVDLFMGDGLAAETAAGRLKHPGTLYFLVLKPADGRSTP